MSSYMVEIVPLVYCLLASAVTDFSLHFRVFQSVHFLFHCGSCFFLISLRSGKGTEE